VVGLARCRNAWFLLDCVPDDGSKSSDMPNYVKAPEVVPGVTVKGSGKEPYALAHNIGLGGACVVTVLKRPDFWQTGGSDGRDRLGYNYGADCREPTKADLDR
jgi:hypothetical protein